MDRSATRSLDVLLEHVRGAHGDAEAAARAASVRDDRPVDMLRRSEKLKGMLDRSRKHPLIADEATSDDEQPKQVIRDPAAVELGRKGGLRGGPARAAKLTPERRSEIARKAARARWDKG